ncbi:GntR family transcriptional regulator [Oerskovia sp. M15]
MSPRKKPDDQAPSAVERAFAAVSASIITGEIAPGSLLTEGKVADELGISRTPVREAFLQLQTCRLLTLFPKRGAVVAPVTDKEVSDLLAVRIMLESAAVRALGGRPCPTASPTTSTTSSPSRWSPSATRTCSRSRTRTSPSTRE